MKNYHIQIKYIFTYTVQKRKEDTDLKDKKDILDAWEKELQNLFTQYVIKKTFITTTNS